MEIIVCYSLRRGRYAPKPSSRFALGLSTLVMEGHQTHLGLISTLGLNLVQGLNPTLDAYLDGGLINHPPT